MIQGGVLGIELLALVLDIARVSLGGAGPSSTAKR